MFRSMFGPITIRVHGPGQAIIIVLFAVGINLNVSGSQFFPRCVQVIYGGGRLLPGVYRKQCIEQTLPLRRNSCSVIP